MTIYIRFTSQRNFVLIILCPKDPKIRSCLQPLNYTEKLNQQKNPHLISELSFIHVRQTYWGSPTIKNTQRRESISIKRLSIGLHHGLTGKPFIRPVQAKTEG